LVGVNSFGQLFLNFLTVNRFNCFPTVDIRYTGKGVPSSLWVNFF